MPLRLADVKRTVRSRADGERYIHPKTLDGAADLARLALVLNYFEAHLGRERADIDAEALLRFLGEPILARGVVACLGGTYRWRGRHFAEVLEDRQVRHLAARGIATPTDLRLHLFDALNRDGDGFLGGDREEILAPLARRLRLSTAKLDQLVALDAEEHAVLVRGGPVPCPEQVLRAYNFAVADALLRHSETLRLAEVPDTVTGALERACAQQGVPCVRAADEVVLRGTPDVFGSFARSGGRLARAVYLAAAMQPTILRRGRARVRVPGKAAWYELDRKALLALTGGAARVRAGAELAGLREEWDRLRQRGGTAGWRLRINPEPVATAAGLVVATAACTRGEHTVLLWPVASRPALDDLRALADVEAPILALADERHAGLIPDQIPAAPSSCGAAGMVEALNRQWVAEERDAAEQALESLLHELSATGFIEEARIATALGCPDNAELASRLRLLDPARGVYVAGVGICNPAFAEAMRRGLRRARRRSPAA